MGNISNTRLSILKKDMIIIETIQFNKNFNRDVLVVIIKKNDTDGLAWIMEEIFEIDAYDTPIYLLKLEASTDVLEKLYIKRHNQNMNTCGHSSTTVVNHNVLCVNCLANLGTHLVVDLDNRN